MVTFSQILELDVNGLESFAKHWNDTIHRRIGEAYTVFDEDVVDKLHGDHWRGKGGGRSAQRYCDRVEVGIDALKAQVRAVCRFIDQEADGEDGKGGIKGLQELQRRARGLQDEVTAQGMRISEDGTIEWADLTDPDDAEADECQEKRKRQAEGFAKDAKAIIRKASENDQWIADSLRVIFGTPHNFETEDRRYGVFAPTTRDRMVHNKLNNLAAGLAAKGLPTAAGLLLHYLEGSGKTVEVDPDQMLQEIPQFQKDLDHTLDTDVRERPDGPFETEWRSSKSPPGKEGNMDWYYALHHFEYRVVGEKKDGVITYHTEVRKQYDWGTPSEHRRDLSSGYPAPFEFDFEQADIAHLNSTGMARDFRVVGRSDESVRCA